MVAVASGLSELVDQKIPIFPRYVHHICPRFCRQGKSADHYRAAFATSPDNPRVSETWPDVWRLIAGLAHVCGCGR